ncbi:MAG: hypothetical protein ACI4OE_06955 [Alphaproteobacteria bacterium]
MGFERKLIGVPDALFDTLEDYPAETAWEVFQAVRAYVHFWDIHRTDDGFDVSAMSADGKAVFRSVVKKLRQYSADYYGVSVEKLPPAAAPAHKTATEAVSAPQANDDAPVSVSDAEDDDYNPEPEKMADMATHKHAAEKLRKKERERKKKWRRKNAKSHQKGQTGQNWPQSLTGQGVQQFSARNFVQQKPDGTKSASKPCRVRDSGDFCDARVYNIFKLLDYNYSNSKDYWKGGVGENQVIHNHLVDNPVDNLNHGEAVSSNPTSGLSGSKAVSVAAVPATSGSKEEGRKGGQEDRDLPAAEAAGGDSKAETCAGGAEVPENQTADCAEHPERGGLRPGSAKEVCGDAPSAKEFHLLSAPHAVTVGEVFIDRNFKIDFSDEFFSPYRKADGFLRRGVEKWLIANKYGCSVEKRWICGLIYKFARRQGKVATLLGADPPPDMS